MNWGRLAKRIGQSVTAIFNVFFGPVPVPIPLTVWPRVIIALAIVISLPLLRAVHHNRWRRRTTVAAMLLIVGGVTLGVRYWMALPTRTLEVRGARYVIGTETKETQDQRKSLDVDLGPLIDGLPNRPVESFFEPTSLSDNTYYLGLHYILFLACVTVGIMISLEWIP